MKLLVTGGAGFIGSNFILYWLNKYPADQVVNLDKLTYAGNLENLASISEQPNYKFVKGDICDSKIVNTLVQTCDVIVHFAAESHVDRSITSPGEFIQTNVVGTQMLLQAALEYKKRFHHVSTDEVFGTLPLSSSAKFNELSPYNPHSPYSASKAASDHLVRAYHDTYGLPITITNCTNNYGPWHFPEKFIPLAITNLMFNKPVPVYGQGLNVRDWLYVEDHCRAIDLVLKKGVIGETYCVGGNSEIDNLSLVKLILKLMDKPESAIKFVTDRLGHDLRYAMDYNKIERDLGWQPSVDLITGLKRTITWFENHRSWIKIQP
ncbi:MAG: dTDP-glucose 4,6-dehydratase [Patescibacteria group bacterium]|jgi:dTDP-glucose 4,6-dehydratase